MNTTTTTAIAIERPARCEPESSLHGIHSNLPPPLFVGGGGGGGAENVGVRISGFGGGGGAGAGTPPRIADDGTGAIGFRPVGLPAGFVNGVAQ
jgi:hypothetical protein